MSANKVIICGKIIKPEENKEFFEKVGSKNINVLQFLPKDKDDYIFYVLVDLPNNNPFEDDIKKVVACRFNTKNTFKRFRHDYTCGTYIYMMGHLASDESEEYYNYVIVDHLKNVSEDTPNHNLVIISGITKDILNTKFIKIHSNDDDNNIDVYRKYNNSENEGKEVEPNYKISFVGHIQLSSGIDEPTHPKSYADNAIFIDDVYRYYSISKYKSLGFAPSKEFNSILKKYSKFTFNNNSEVDIFNNFKYIEKLDKLNYDDLDIINFHIAMKNKGLVILAGPSGTGKTALVRSYAGALGLLNSNNDNIQYLHISVSPSWTDDSDLLGYYDSRKRVYHPSNTGLVNLLINASKPSNKHKLYIVLLDEMNLSHIEYYFSQFLSILELPKGDNDRRIRLFGDNNRIGEDKNHIPSSIPVFDNILFVGTINIDESTKVITDKVLDRSNLIIMSSNEFNTDLFRPKDANKLKQLLKSIQPITVDNFNSFKNESSANSLVNNDNIANSRLKLLNDLNKAFKDATYKRLEIGYRVVKQINEYLCDIPNNLKNIGKDSKEFTEEAFDMQLCQRIFDKLNGDKFHLHELILLLHASLYGNSNEKNKLSTRTLQDDCSELTEDFQNVKEYRYSKKIINRKLMELDNYGFTE